MSNPIHDRATSDAPGSRSASGNPRPLKILVIDDGESAADMLALFFEFEGYEVRKAYDGERGLEIAAEMEPDLVLLDLAMPGIDGYETARRLRETPAGRQAALVALTGWSEDSERDRTTEAGFDHHLVKPAEPKMLRDLLVTLGLRDAGGN